MQRKILLSNSVKSIVEYASELLNQFDECYVVDKEGRTLWINEGCEKFYGLPAEKIIGRKASEMQKEGMFSHATSSAVLRRKEAVVQIKETRLGRKLLIFANPVLDEAGNVKMVVGVGKDITEDRDFREVCSGFMEKQNMEQVEAPGVVWFGEESRRTIILVDQAATTDVSVLIMGETGTGKEMLARRVHYMSRRRSNPWIKVNCAAIPPTLFETELFGHRKGAFTGAVQDKPGLIESANRGTLFLDEIGEMPLEMQAKLLQVLEDRQFRRVGDTRMNDADIRLVAATNSNLEEKIEEGSFRADLYYRINIIEVRVKPLKERQSEILPLLDHYLTYFNDFYGKHKQLSSEVRKLFLGYSWPGNVRELRNIVERLVITSAEDVIGIDFLKQHNKRFLSTTRDNSMVSIRGIMPLRSAIEELEKQLISEASRQFQTTYEMAKVLGVNQSTVSRKIHRYLSGIDKDCEIEDR